MTQDEPFTLTSTEGEERRKLLLRRLCITKVQYTTKVTTWYDTMDVLRLLLLINPSFIDKRSVIKSLDVSREKE